ncbi:MAG: ACP S-malonyltransferase [Clostridia bacterium]|nr:ACP S-malonyltransferase [Clostridia bacterium]
MKIGVLFAGQGAQKPGMGRSLCESVPAAREIFDTAEKILPGITQLCFEGPQEKLNETIWTQPCVYTVDCACWAAFSTLGVRPAVGAGFSLGEYAALYAASVFSFETGLKLVKRRAEFMQEAAELHPGSMAAVLGLEAREVEEIVDLIRGQGVLAPVNYNCPGQTVVAGDVAEMDSLISYARDHRLKVTPLATSGAFHSERMQEAAARTGEVIRSETFSEPDFVLYANQTGLPYETDAMKDTLEKQTSSPVLFEQILRGMLADGCDLFVELGPGRTLAGFLRRIDRKASVYNLNDYASLEQLAQVLQAGGNNA